jgi:hypothetical protein
VRRDAVEAGVHIEAEISGSIFEHRFFETGIRDMVLFVGYNHIVKYDQI